MVRATDAACDKGANCTNVHVTTTSRMLKALGDTHIYTEADGLRTYAQRQMVRVHMHRDRRSAHIYMDADGLRTYAHRQMVCAHIYGGNLLRHTHMHSHTHSYTHTFTYTPKNTNTHTHGHTHSQRSKSVFKAVVIQHTHIHTHLSNTHTHIHTHTPVRCKCRLRHRVDGVDGHSTDAGHTREEPHIRVALDKHACEEEVER
jgi:hypothetical protein